jgi:hypothetical protein
MKFLTTPFKPSFAQQFANAIDVLVIPFGFCIATSILFEAFRFESIGLPLILRVLAGGAAFAAGAATVYSISIRSRLVTAVALILFFLSMISWCWFNRSRIRREVSF